MYIISKRGKHRHDPLAQLAEHLTFNQGVRSSNLRWITIKGPSEWDGPFSFVLLIDGCMALCYDKNDLNREGQAL